MFWIPKKIDCPAGRGLLLCLALCLGYGAAGAGALDTLPPTPLVQKQPRVRVKPHFSHARNALLFGIFPGGGQIYNGRYWKLPIVYGGMAAIGYFMIDSGVRYGCYRRAYREAVDDDPTTNYRCRFESDTAVAPNLLKLRRDQYQSRTEYLAIGFTVYYALVLVDAFVDAHFREFDVDDNLSMGIRPRLQYDPLLGRVQPGLSLSLRPHGSGTSTRSFKIW